MVARGQVPGSAVLVVANGAALLRPQVQVFEAVLDGWRSRKVSRSLNSASIIGAIGVVRRFRDRSGEFPRLRITAQ